MVPPQPSCDAGALLVEHEANHRALALVLKNEWSELAQDRIALAEGCIHGVLDRVDAERRGADRVMLSDRVEEVARAPFIKPRLRNEERVATPRVLLAPLVKIAKIDVWTQHIDVRRACEPDIECVGQRATARPIARDLARAAQPGVHEHRDVVFRLAGRGYAIDVAGIVPGHKDLIGLRPAPEDLRPTPGGLESTRFPVLPNPDSQLVLVLLELIDQFLRHRPGKRTIGRVGAITRIA